MSSAAKTRCNCFRGSGGGQKQAAAKSLLLSSEEELHIYGSDGEGDF